MKTKLPKIKGFTRTHGVIFSRENEHFNYGQTGWFVDIRNNPSITAVEFSADGYKAKDKKGNIKTSEKVLVHHIMSESGGYMEGLDAEEVITYTE